MSGNANFYQKRGMSPPERSKLENAVAGVRSALETGSDVENALIELAEMITEQEDALVEIAEIIGGE